MKRLSENDHIDFYRHLAFCTVGGFFGAYAVLVHSGVMGNAQTMNLLEMVIDLLRWQLPDMLLHLGALALYVLGTMLTVLLPHWCGADTHYLSPIVTAVAAVVLNRVRSSSFPNTISGVIYQTNAFSCVNNGSINNTPDSSCIRAALDALNGWDPTGGCLYYYNPKTAVDGWIRTRTVKTVIGNHSFAV